MRRGQIIGQIFVLILASAVFILILLYGYKAISQFSTRSEQVAFINFETDFKNAVKEVSLDYGSVKKLDLTLPNRYKQVCVFCSPDKKVGWTGCDNTNAPEYQDILRKHALLVESWSGGAQNVFLVPLADTPILIDRVEVSTVGFCTNLIEGKVSLRLEGKGDRALVSPWPAQ
jgi:hypothetical protein